MQCLDWANEISKSTETETKETNKTVKGFFTRSLGCIILPCPMSACSPIYLMRSKILELNGLTGLDEATAQATMMDLLEESEAKYGHTRQERGHKNPLLEAESTEKDSATDRIKQLQSGSVDGSQLGSLMCTLHQWNLLRGSQTPHQAKMGGGRAGGRGPRFGHMRPYTRRDDISRHFWRFQARPPTRVPSLLGKWCLDSQKISTPDGGRTK